MTQRDRNSIIENVDSAEVARFDALAPVWWDKHGEFKALHDINVLRLSYINARSALSGKKVVDVGCGGGILSEAMAELGADVTGIDMGEAPLAIAKLHSQASGLDIAYLRDTAESFSERHPEFFDVVTCLELLEHVPDPASIVLACQKLVKPGGDVFIATLNRNLKSFVFAIVGAEYILGLVRKGTHSYRKFVKPAELEGWALAAGLRTCDRTGLHYNPFLRRYSLGGNLHVNYLMHFRKPAAGKKEDQKIRG